MKSLTISTATNPKHLKLAIKKALRREDLITIDDNFEYKDFGYQKLDFNPMLFEDEHIEYFQLLMHKLAEMKIWVKVMNITVLAPAQWQVGTGRWRQTKTAWIRYNFLADYDGNIDEWKNWAGGPFQKEGKDGQVEVYSNFKHSKREKLDIIWQ